jgi:putative oxidoreductase
MNSLQRYALVTARIVVAIVFLANGFGVIPQAAAAKVLADHGTPATLVPLFMLTARTIEIIGGFDLILGIYPQIAAIALIAFLVPATLMGHAFWQVEGTPAYIPQLLNFLKFSGHSQRRTRKEFHDTFSLQALRRWLLDHTPYACIDRISRGEPICPMTPISPLSSCLHRC